MGAYQAVVRDLRPDIVPRNTIGGDAIVPAKTAIPNCRRCKKKLLLFLQFDIEKRWMLPFKAGSHFVLFMCQNCNELPSFAPLAAGQLPPGHGKLTEGHFFAALFTKSSEERVSVSKPILVPKELQFKRAEGEGYLSGTIRVGGKPFWLQNPERFVCCCGCELALISQISENFGFAKSPDAPEQPDSFSSDEYCLFLGNEIYIFGCPEQCDPRSVWITVQG